ncbi:hypothetical protein D0N36_12465 [Hymenobacter lapidiphilus]|nr:hypothetical protein D0N36_12465 [Hymenobacter sp. CCM 8763]
MVAQTTGQASYNLHLAESGLPLRNNTAARSYAVFNQYVEPGDTLRSTITVEYDVNRIPFALEKLLVRLVNPAGDLVASAPAFVFFTPYQTVEVWNRTDLDNLNRVWDVPNTGVAPTRRYVSERDIPLSDLTDDELADPDVPKKLKSIVGLAYSIPMKDVGQDSEEGEAELEDLEGISQRGMLVRHTWSAAVSGRVLTEQWNGRSSTVRAAFPLAVSGIRVELWDKDGLLDDFLASATTDDDGRFTINFSNTQGSEGSYLELYLKIEASAPGGVIRVIKRIGITRNGTIGQSNPTGLHFDTRALNLGDVGPSHDDVKPHLLHYAWQSRRFLERNGLGSVLPNSQSQPLKIMISPLNLQQDQALFIPGGYRNVAAGTLIAVFGRFGFIGLGAGVVTAAGLTLYLSNDDCLYIGENRETEEVAYHEFGHYVMWHMQNRSWSDLTASFAKHGDTRNANPGLAWTEGWADGFSRIMDAYTVRYDGERDVDDGGNGNEDRTGFDRLRQPVLRNGAVTDEFTLTHGVLSEYFISTTIYDLWDGANNLALRSNSPLAATTTGGGAPTGNANPPLLFTDDIPSNPFVGQRLLDESSLSFADLTAPIRSRRGNGSFSAGLSSAAVIQDITQYYQYLLQDLGDCEQSRLAANVFLINRISDFPTQRGLPATAAPTQRLGTDELQRTATLTEPFFKRDGAIFYQDGAITLPLTLDVNELSGAAQSYNLAATVASGTGRLSDPLTVRSGARLGIHFGAERGYAGSGQNTLAGSNFSANLCGRFRLTLADDGRLEVGDDGRGNTAEVSVQAGGLLDAQANSTVRVSTNSVIHFLAGSALVVRNGATLIVNGGVRLEAGSFLCVETGANLVFAPGSVLYVDPGASLGLPASFGLPPLACSPELGVCGTLAGNNPNVINTANRNEALAFDGLDDLVTIPNNGSPLAGGDNRRTAKLSPAPTSCCYEVSLLNLC